MAYIQEQSQWDDGIYQLEITDPVGGGPDGIDNRPHKHLANRSLWLKANKADIGGDSSLNFKVAAGIATDDAVNLGQLNTKADLTLVDTKADIGGDNTQRFKVADALTDDEAVSKALLNSFRRPPIGTISFELMDVPREYQIKALGEEFSRTEYPDLWEFISAQTNLLKSESEWQSENSSNGMCGYYSSGDGSTSFRVPNLLGATFKGVSSSVGRYEGDENKAHTHSASTNSTGGHRHNLKMGIVAASGSSRYAFHNSGSDYMSTEGSHSHTVTINSQGASENTVKNIGVLPLIVAK